MATKGSSSILVPTDFSAGAQAALERALLLPLAAKAKLTLLHVLPPDIPGRLRKEAIADAERSLEKQLAQARTEVMSRQLEVQFVGDVVEGDAPYQVMKRANTIEADAICIGRHGRRGVIDLFVGSTATRVLRQTDHPLLLVRESPKGPYERPFIAIDPTHKALGVVKAGLSLLSPSTTRVSIFTATPIPYEDFVSLGTSERIELRRKFEKDGEKALAAMLKKLPGFAFHPIVRSGDARSLVVEESLSQGADLTVLGTHGRTALNRLLVGSVAEWVLAHARNDVLIVRP